MPDLPELRDHLLPRPMESRLPRKTARELASVQHRTIVRTAGVQGEAIVQATKLHEIDHLTREAMTGQALLCKWRDTLAAGDPFLGDELKFFCDIARLGKGEIIADTITAYSRECRS